MLSYMRYKFSQRIESRLAKTVRARLVGFQVYSKEFPPYRFLDLYNAVEAYGRLRNDVVAMQSEHQEDLNAILNGKRPHWTSRNLKKSTFLSWPSDYDQERSLPVDCFWVWPRAAEGDSEPLIIRLRFDLTYGGKVYLEAASPKGGWAERALESIVSRSVEQSVYRNKVLELAYEAGTKDAYGDIERPSQLRVLFKVVEPVGDDDIIIGEKVKEILWRNIIDLHQRREILKAHHVPVRRGVLLYGPPGTGKTFACRYLCGKLPNATRIIVTGSALHQVNSIFTLARLLQPSLVILEDVDLVFSSREINLYSSVLGDMLDQMDGLRPFEDIGFVLTTKPSIAWKQPSKTDRGGSASASTSARLNPNFADAILRAILDTISAPTWSWSCWFGTPKTQPKLFLRSGSIARFKSLRNAATTARRMSSCPTKTSSAPWPRCEVSVRVKPGGLLVFILEIGAGAFCRSSAFPRC